jgi:hypothetical protein
MAMADVLLDDPNTLKAMVLAECVTGGCAKSSGSCNGIGSRRRAATLPEEQLRLGLASVEQIAAA